MMSKTLKLLSWIVGFGIFLLSALAAGQQLVNVSIRHDLTLIGLDWARHVETRLEKLIEPAIASGTLDRHMLPSDAEYLAIVKDVLLIGHVTQIDLINADCLCEVSVHKGLGVGRAAMISMDDPADDTEDHSGHAHAQPRVASSFSNVTRPHPVAADGTPQRLAQASHTPGLIPISRAVVTKILQAGQPQTQFLSLDQADQPRRVAEVFYPVDILGENLFLLRLVINFDPIIGFYRQIVAIAGAGLLVLLSVFLGIPLRAYVRQARRASVANKEVTYRAEHDMLTGIASRDSFQRRIVEQIPNELASGKSGMIVLFDIDRFKEVNDFHGHPAGDQVLVATVSRIREALGDRAQLARLGGDEFILQISGLDLPDIAFFQALAAPFSVALPGCSDDVQVSLSIGVAKYPSDGTTLSELMKAGDLALYAAKDGGRAQALAFSPDMLAAFERRINVLTQFRDGDALDRLVPYYQPVVALSTGRIMGLEVLCRWQHPEKGIVAAGSFHEVFGDPQIARAIGVTMLRRAAEDLACWRENGLRDISVGINAEEADLLFDDFYWCLDGLFGEGALRPGDVVIEITEKCMFGGNRDRLMKRVHQIKAMGCKISIDDFGAGYTSITQLRDLPRTSVKIDKSFIDEIDTDEDNGAIVAAVVGLGKAMGFGVVAEGLETEAQVSAVRRLGCRLGQGFLLSCPMPAEEVPEAVRRIEEDRLGLFRSAG